MQILLYLTAPGAAVTWGIFRAVNRLTHDHPINYPKKKSYAPDCTAFFMLR